MISNFTRNSNIIDIDKNIDISCQSSRNQSGKKKKRIIIQENDIYIRRNFQRFDRFSNDDCQGFYYPWREWKLSGKIWSGIRSYGRRIIGGALFIATRSVRKIELIRVEGSGRWVETFQRPNPRCRQPNWRSLVETRTLERESERERKRGHAWLIDHSQKRREPSWNNRRSVFPVRDIDLTVNHPCDCTSRLLYNSRGRFSLGEQLRENLVLE